MLFSVIVPIYKVEEYLDRCVESLVGQTCSDIEIILVDDGSPDKCPEMCDTWAERDSRIKVIHKENGGLSDARNAGLKAATGEYIAFVDSDDYIEENTFERFFKYTEEKADILVGDLEVLGGENYFGHAEELLDKKISGEEYLIVSIRKNRAPAPACINIYHREFLIENSLDFKVGILHEDEHFMPRVFLAAESVIYTGINFYRYIIRENSITTKKDKRKNSDHVYKICEELEGIYQQIKNKTLKNLLSDRLAVLCLTTYYFNDLNKYGKNYQRKGFIGRNAKTLKTRILALIYAISPSLFCAIYKAFAKK